MAPLPKRRHSTRRGGKRTAALKVRFITGVKCGHCGNYNLPHRVCQNCGYYQGKEIIKPKVKKAKK